MSEPQYIQLPRLGAHIRLWGTGHWCDSDEPHDDPCVCICDVVAPFDEPSGNE